MTQPTFATHEVFNQSPPFEDVDLFAADRPLVEAVAAHRRVRIAYRSAAGHEWTSEVDPWAVVVRYGLWYLLCRTRSAELRTYRLDRIGSVEQEINAAQVDIDQQCSQITARRVVRFVAFSRVWYNPPRRGHATACPVAYSVTCRRTSSTGR